MKRYIIPIFIALFVLSCSDDDEFVRNDFSLDFERAVALSASELTFNFEVDSDTPITLSPFNITEVSDLDNTGVAVRANGAALASNTQLAGNALQISLDIVPEEGFQVFTVELDNGPSKKYINFQYLVEGGEVIFASVNHTESTSERNLVTTYEEGIFRHNFFTSRSQQVFIDNGTATGKEWSILRVDSNELQYVTSSGGTTVFKLFVQDLPDE